MFNTLGNLVEYPRAGLLFVDFATGDVLQLTGTARLEHDPVASTSTRSARRARPARCASGSSRFLPPTRPCHTRTPSGISSHEPGEPEEVQT